MPFETQPIGEANIAPGAPPTRRWIDSQPFSRELSFESANSLYRPGTIRGGPTTAQQDMLIDPRKYAIFAPAPIVTERAATQAKPFSKFGNMTLSLIDPFATQASFAGGAGANPDQQAALVRGEQSFLAQRDIGLENAPVRAFDYLAGLLPALYDHVAGKAIVAPMPSGANEMKYAFQKDPGYWALLSGALTGTTGGATDAVLAGIANGLASKYNDPGIAALLLEQFKVDRDRVLGLSTGDRRLDYQAKLIRTNDYIAERTGGKGAPLKGGLGQRGQAIYAPDSGRGTSQAAYTAALMQLPSAVLGSLPFVGADLREAAYKIDPVIEADWRKLTAEQRNDYIGQAGAQMLVGDVVVWLPLMGAIGGIEAVAARQGGMALKAWQTTYRTYEIGRNITASAMALGLATATANWAAEAASPAYAEGFGRRLDYARPISSSSLAGLLNQMGFFASGTFGASLAAHTAARVPGAIGRAGGDLAGLTRVVGPRSFPVPQIGDLAAATARTGARELSWFKAIGGSPVRNVLARVGLPDPFGNLLDIAPKATFTSHLLNRITATRRATWEAYAAGHSVGDDVLDAITDPALRFEVAQRELLKGLDQAHGEAAGITQAMTEARRPRPLLGGEQQRMHDAAVKLARHVDDDMAKVYVNEYGAEWLTRLAGKYDRVSLGAYARGVVERLGGKPAKLGEHNEEGWGQIIRYLHSVEYHHNNGALQAAIVGTEEGSRVMLMQANHVFANEVPELVTKLQGDDAVLAKLLTVETIQTKKEAAEWFARDWKPEAGVPRKPENVPPAELASFLEEIAPSLPSRRLGHSDNPVTAGEPLNAFQAKLEREGLWTIGFKPTNEAGDLVSYVRRPNGKVFQSPWVEYPMGNAEAIELGNRSILLSKLDGITRGQRTWKIVEFQKGLLYRRLSTKMVNVNPEQIERFHAGILRIARAWNVQPQTVGAAARAETVALLGVAAREKVDELVKDVFGAGRHLDAKGRPIDFYGEITKSYRQSFKINQAAGLTSLIKAYIPGGSEIAMFTDIGYVLYRFGMSPVFWGGEFLETAMFNLGRGVRGIDTETQMLWRNFGVGRDMGPLAAETGYDDIVRSITDRDYGINAAQSQQAARAALVAKNIPEDFEIKTRIAFEQGAAAENVAKHGGGDLPTEGWMPQSGPQRDIQGNPIYTDQTRVVREHEIPDTHTVELGDIRPDLLDPDQLASEQGILHATTALDRVMDEGVLARIEQVADDLAPVKGEGFDAWRARTGAPEASGSIYLRMSRAEYDAVEASPSGAILPAKGLFDNKRHLTRDPKTITAASDDVIVEFDAKYVHAAKKDLSTTKAIDVGARNRVWTWDAAAGDHVLTYESVYAKTQVRQGLGGGRGDRVSTTYSQAHADAIAARMRFVPRAARNEVDNGAIVDHFAEWYGDDWRAMGRILGASDSVAITFQTGDDLVRWMDTKGKYLSGETKYHAVQDLDSALAPRWHQGDQAEFGGYVGLAGKFEDALRIDPNQVGVVRLAVRKRVTPEEGLDHGTGGATELTFYSRDLLVIDDRMILDALADTEEGLLKQLRATLAESPKEGQLTIVDQMVGGNGIAPGMETRARAILTKLEGIEGRRLDGGPTWQWMNVGEAKQAEFEAQLAKDGWAPARDKIAELYAKGDQSATNEAQRITQAMGSRAGLKHASSPPHVQGLGDQVDWETPIGAAAKVDAEWRQFFKESGSGEPGTIEAQTGVRAGTYASDRHLRYVLFDADRKPAGVLDLLTEPKHPEASTRVSSLTVRPDVRNRGIASALYDRAAADGHDLIAGPERVFLTEQGKGFRVGYMAKRGIGDDLYARTRLDGTAEAKPIAQLFDEAQQRPGNATHMEDVAGTPEAIWDNLLPRLAEEGVNEPGWRGRAWRKMKQASHPAGWKIEHGVDPLTIKLAREDFPSWLRLSGNDGEIRLFKQLGIPEQRWLDWLIKDRVLARKWTNSRSQADWDALLAHAPGDNAALRAGFNDFYASEEWASLSALIATGLEAGGETAFGVHFFNAYRSPLERSLNHPVLGIYPLSWALKAAREWGKFLFDNKTLGINLGMAPAQAIASLVHAQAAAVAQAGGDLGELTDIRGPIGSPLLIFNLLLPGDWSGLPFPMSRTLRDYVRPLLQGGNMPDPMAELWNNLETMGAGRDWRLFTESLGQMSALLNGPEAKDPAKVLRNYSIRGPVPQSWEPSWK